MTDLIYVAIILGFFLLAIGYLAATGTLSNKRSDIE